MARQVYLLDLADEALAAEYEAWHRPGNVPQGVLDDVVAAGFRVMEIYRFGSRLVMVTETEGEQAPADRESSDASRDWERRMDKYQKPLVDGGDKWLEATRVFRLSDHTDQGRES